MAVSSAGLGVVAAWLERLASVAVAVGCPCGFLTVNDFDIEREAARVVGLLDPAHVMGYVPQRCAG